MAIYICITNCNLDTNKQSPQSTYSLAYHLLVMVIDRSIKRRLATHIAILLAGIIIGVGITKVVENSSRGELVSEIISVAGFWSILLVIVLIASIPIGFNYSSWYSYDIVVGLTFGIVYISGWPYPFGTPTLFERISSAIFVGVVSGLIITPIAVVIGTLWRYFPFHPTESLTQRG